MLKTRNPSRLFYIIRQTIPFTDNTGKISIFQTISSTLGKAALDMLAQSAIKEKKKKLTYCYNKTSFHSKSQNVEKQINISSDTQSETILTSHSSLFPGLPSSRSLEQEKDPGNQFDVTVRKDHLQVTFLLSRRDIHC